MVNSKGLMVAEVLIGPQRLPGTLSIPAQSQGLVLFAHGSGSSRKSTRNRFVAQQLQERWLATLLFDLLTEDEARDRQHVFDIPLLATRMVAAIAAMRDNPMVATLPMGLFGASTGAAAALVTAAIRPSDILTVVSRGGRPDLAGDYLAQVTQPVLLIVGGEDREVIQLNRQAAAQLAGPHSLQVIPHATHLFEEPGTLETVATLAGDWFARHLTVD